jgi:uncharacterized damage-inducible protein DinB
VAAIPAELRQWAAEWKATRALTYDLLRSLPYAVMNFSPHEGFGTFARQIRHLGDIQACYLLALQTGTMDFAARPRQRALEQSREQIDGYLQALDAQLDELLQGMTPQRLAASVAWEGKPVGVLAHLMRLLQHESLHHGMLAFYAKIADLPLPPSWRAWSLE